MIVADRKPAKLWHHVIGQLVSPIKITPVFALHILNSGRHGSEVVDQAVAVVETACAINRMMGRAPHFGT